mgnify:CR=1 FL=1
MKIQGKSQRVQDKKYDVIEFTISHGQISI